MEFYFMMFFAGCFAATMFLNHYIIKRVVRNQKFIIKEMGELQDALKSLDNFIDKLAKDNK